MAFGAFNTPSIIETSEPAGLGLVGAGILGAAFMRRRLA